MLAVASRGPDCVALSEETQAMSISPRSQSDEPLAGHAYPLLYNVVYCSRAADGIDDAAVARIIETSLPLNR